MSIALGDTGSANGQWSLVLYERFNSLFTCVGSTSVSMFSASQAAGLTLKTSKLQFGAKQVKRLGHVISEHGIANGDDRIDAISELPDPKNIKELRSLLGTLDFARRFAPEYAEVTSPLVELTKKQYKQRRENLRSTGEHLNLKQ